MTKLNIQRVFETNRLLKTEAGRQLQELINFVYQFSEQSIRALRNGIGVSDNLDAAYITADLVSGENSILNAGGRSPIALFPVRVVEEGARVSEFGWSFNDSSELVVNVVITGTALDSYSIVFLAIYS